MADKKSLKIVTKDGITQVYDKDGNNICEKMSIAHISVEYDAASQSPTINLTIHSPDLEIITDDADIKVKHKIIAHKT